jgi:hypothetical protein
VTIIPEGAGRQPDQPKPNIDHLHLVAEVGRVLETIDSALTSAKSLDECKIVLESIERRLSALLGEPDPSTRSCDARHPEDPTPCDGPHDAVIIHDGHGAHITACARHAATLLVNVRGTWCEWVCGTPTTPTYRRGAVL